MKKEKDILIQKNELITHCCGMYGELTETKTYIPRVFFKYSWKSIFKDFKIKMKFLDKEQKEKYKQQKLDFKKKNKKCKKTNLKQLQ